MTRHDPQNPGGARTTPATANSTGSRPPLWQLGWALLVPLVHVPLVVIGTLPSVLMMTLLAIGTGFAIAVPFLLSRSRFLDGLAEGLGRRAVALLWAGILAYVAASIGCAAWRFANFQDYIQLGMFNQSMWTTLRGYLFANTAHTSDGTMCSHLGVHFSPTLLPLALPYALWPTALTMQAANAVALGLIPLPLFALFKHRMGRGAAVVLALAAFLVPNFLVAGTRDMRYSGFLPVLLFTAVWALETRRWPALWIASVAALGVREDTGLVIAFLGLYALISGRGRKVAFGLVALGLAWFVVVTSFVMPRLGTPSLMWGPEDFMYLIFGKWGRTPGLALLNMVTHPVELIRGLPYSEFARYLYALFLPLLGIPAFTSWLIVPALPGLGVNLLSAWSWMRYAPYQYSMVPIAFGTLAAFQTAARLGARAMEQRREATCLAAALVIVCGLAPSLGMVEAGGPTPPVEAARAMVQAIPRDVSLYMPGVFYPHLGGRMKVGLPVGVGENILDPNFRRGYDYVLVWRGQRPPDMPFDSLLIAAMPNDPGFEVARIEGPLVLYRNKNSSPAGGSRRP
jgi:uncharacterized membrane protein